MSTKKAIVVYLDNNREQILFFERFLRSSFYLSNIKDVDLVVFHPNSLDIENSNNIVGCPIFFRDSFCETYKFIKSIQCIAEHQGLLSQYDYLMRSDVDVFLLPNFNNIDWTKFQVGKGAYNNDNTVKNNIFRVHEDFDLKIRSDYTTNIGSTWIGPSSLVTQAATLTTKLTKHIYNSFRDNGKWPSWYRPVSLLYGAEIAVNQIEKFEKRPDFLDFDSTSSNSIDNHAHIHCWHTDNMFSKFAYLQHQYRHINLKNINIKEIRNYCLYVARTF
mgnify:CR=1 FL=1